MTTGYESTDTALAVHTLNEAAAILRVRKSWLERQAAARKIPFAMLGGTYRFTSDHLAAIVRIHEIAPCGQDETERREANDKAPRAARQHARPQTVTPLQPRPRTGPRRAA
jgi:excisionase family DNA binding protein